MDRLSPLDATFVDIEDEDPHASLAIASIAVFEGPAPTYEELCAGIGGRLPLVPRYRQKLRRIPFRLGPPVWVDDAHFDLEYHVRRTALPAPGGDAELGRLMGRVMGQRLDREHPMWEYWLVDGLEEGRWALISKVHHSMVDGISGTDLYRILFDLAPDAPPVVLAEAPAAPEPSPLSLLARAAKDAVALPAVDVRALAAGALHPARLVRRGAGLARGVWGFAKSLPPAPASSLSGHIGRQRRYAWARASLADVKAVKDALGGTVNDVVLSAIAGGFRELLLERHEGPLPHVLPSLVPVSVRAPGEESILANRVSAMVVHLPVEVGDPQRRLEETRRRMAVLKASGEAEAGEMITAIARYVPFAVASLTRFVFRVPQREIVTVTTNVPGPRQPLWCQGRRLVEILPYVPIATTMRVGISIFSYCDSVTFGITGDWDTTPDLDVLARGIESSLRELVKAAADRSGP